MGASSALVMKIANRILIVPALLGRVRLLERVD
jgi:hypothetical protein